MTKFLNKKLKNIATAAYISLGKVQETLGQSIDGVDNNISIQQEVRKQEIKLVKKERFYDLLDKSFKYEKTFSTMSPDIKKRYLELVNTDTSKMTGSEIYEISKEIHELSGIAIKENFEKFEEPTSFKNQRYGDIMEYIDHLDDNAKYKFETNNELYKLSHYVGLSNKNGDYVELDFFVNKTENPKIRFIDVTDLKYLKVIENGILYHYTIENYIGIISHTDEFDIVYRFASKIEKNGEYVFDMEGDEVILNKYNTPSHKTANFNLGR